LQLLFLTDMERRAAQVAKPPLTVRERLMNIWKLITQMVDMRSFSSLWFWMAIAVYWSLSSHWVLGVPQDMIHRARRIGGEAVSDLETLVRINSQRILYYAREATLPLIAVATFILTVLLILAVAYRIELAQALLCFFIPAILQMLLSIRTSRLIEAGEGKGDAMFRRLFRHRTTIQVLGMFAIFVTGLFGMYHNLITIIPR
jgi:hypothetical protein